MNTLENLLEESEDHPSVSIVENQPMETFMREYLKVKIKSLAAEAKIIRHEERKVKSWKRLPGEEPAPVFFGLHTHRTGDVRQESRASLLAYGFLRGMPYRKIEEKHHTEPNWERVESLVKKYGNFNHNEVKFLGDKIKEWSELCE